MASVRFCLYSYSLTQLNLHSVESELAKALLQLGPGGIIAALMFFWYRADRQRAEEALKTVAADFRQTVEANTCAMTKLTVLVEQIAEEKAEQPPPVRANFGKTHRVS